MAEPGLKELIAAAESEVLLADKEFKRAKVTSIRAAVQMARADEKRGTERFSAQLEATMHQHFADTWLLRSQVAVRDAELSAMHLQWENALVLLHEALAREKKASELSTATLAVARECHSSIQLSRPPTRLAACTLRHRVPHIIITCPFVCHRRDVREI